MPLQQYQAPGLLQIEQAAPGKVETRALLFYEGEHTPGNGRAKKFSAAMLQKIADSTNEYLANGRRIKIYMAATDHRVGQQAAIGLLDGDITVATITDADLPLPGLDSLVGKIGLFGNVSLVTESAIEQYHSGLLKELSIGVGKNNVIYEISAVSIPSLVGAALFSLPEHGSYEFALTMVEQGQEETAARSDQVLWGIVDRFMRVLASIRDADDDDLGGRDPMALRAQAVDDLASQLRAGLQVPSPVIPAYSEEPEMSETFEASTDDSALFSFQLEALQTKMQAELDAKDAQIALFGKRAELDQVYSRLRQRGEALRSQGKLTPAGFDELFDAELPEIETFSMAPELAGSGLDTFTGKLTGIEFTLNHLEKHAAATKFGMPTAGAAEIGNPDPDSEAATFAVAFVEKNLPPVSYR